MKLQNIETRNGQVKITLDHMYVMDMKEIDLQIRTTTQWLQILLKAKERLENEN